MFGFPVCAVAEPWPEDPAPPCHIRSWLHKVWFRWVSTSMPLFGVSWCSADRRSAVRGRLGCNWSPALRTITNVSTMLPRPFQDLWGRTFFSQYLNNSALSVHKCTEILRYLNISTGSLCVMKLAFSVAALVLIKRSCKKGLFIPTNWSHCELNIA